MFAYLSSGSGSMIAAFLALLFIAIPIGVIVFFVQRSKRKDAASVGRSVRTEQPGTDQRL
jgi:hypothetical protein